MLKNIFKSPKLQEKELYDLALLESAVSMGKTGNMTDIQAVLATEGYEPSPCVLTSALARAISESGVNGTKGAPIEGLEILVKAGAPSEAQTKWGFKDTINPESSLFSKGWQDPLVQAVWVANSKYTKGDNTYLDFILEKGVSQKSAATVALHFGELSSDVTLKLAAHANESQKQAIYDKALMEAAHDTAKMGDIAFLVAVLAKPDYTPSVVMLTNALTHTIRESVMNGFAGAPIAALDLLLAKGAQPETTLGEAQARKLNIGKAFTKSSNPLTAAALVSFRGPETPDYLNYLLSKGITPAAALGVATDFKDLPAVTKLRLIAYAEDKTTAAVKLAM